MAAPSPASLSGPSLPPYKLTSDGSTRRIQVLGWTIESTKRPILNAQDADSFSDTLGIPLPEICFGHNSLTLSYPSSGFTYKFDTLSALQEVDNKGEEGGQVKVSYAQDWAKSREGNDAGMKVVHNFDWTFTTIYEGETNQPSTFSIPESSHDGIPLAYLTHPDPILFFDDVTLFEDELHDNGMSSLSVKVRVMPTCWFVLARFFLRVDGVVFRMFDTRLFHLFGTDEVIKEVKGREASYDSVKAKLPLEKPNDLTPLIDPNWVANAALRMLSPTAPLPGYMSPSGNSWKGVGRRVEVARVG